MVPFLDNVIVTYSSTNERISNMFELRARSQTIIVTAFKFS